MNARRVRPLLVVALAFAVPASAEAAQKRHLRLGSLTFHRCLPTRRGWCGSVSRPLDPARSHGARIRIGFQWLPPRHRRSGPALVAVEGGPGYPSAGSVLEYHGIFSRLIGRRGLLLVDNRGTGMSALIDFAPLQSFTGRTSGPRFAARVAGCPAADRAPLPARACRPVRGGACAPAAHRAAHRHHAQLRRLARPRAGDWADDRRPRAGRRLRPGDLPRARPVRARGACRRPRAAAALGGAVRQLRPRNEHGRLLHGRPLLRRELRGLSAAAPGVEPATSASATR
jgi:hypothetical protein